jgi:hypothetical protein
MDELYPSPCHECGAGIGERCRNTPHKESIMEPKTTKRYGINALKREEARLKERIANAHKSIAQQRKNESLRESLSNLELEFKTKKQLVNMIVDRIHPRSPSHD